MPSLTCNQGHQWEPSASQSAESCPHCGGQATATVSLPEQGPETIAHVESAARGPQELLEVAGYDILEVLGHGGMGVVYKARHRALKRLVALKMVLGSKRDPASLNRFRTEAEAVARLRHPNIVQIYEIGEQDGNPYFSLEYVEGGSLDRRLHGTPLLPGAAAQLVETLAMAVEAAHRQGIVHRDLKPANVLLQISDFRLQNEKSDEVLKSEICDLQSAIPKIGDFGLAKQLETDSGQTQAGTIVGTPSYMAPEQAWAGAGASNPSVDVYALGAILYETLTGRPPFRAATVLETLDQVRHHEPVPPSRLQPRLPRDLETICLKCLHKDPGKRYASAAALADDLRRFLKDEPILARPVGRAERLARWCRRKPLLAGMTAALALALVLGVAGILWQWRQAEANYQEKTRQEGIALEQKTRAERNQKAAEESQKTAEERLLQFRRRSYVSDMDLAFAAYDQGTVGRMLELLQAHVPPKGLEDVRGLEWSLLNNLVHREERVLRGTGAIRRVAFSRDGRLLAAGGSEGVISLWDPATGKEQGTLQGHKQPISGLVFAPDGDSLFSIGGSSRQSKDTGEYLVWSLKTRQARPWTQKAPLPSVCLAASLEGRFLVSGEVKGKVFLWNPDTGSHTVLPRAHQQSVQAVWAGPGGTPVVSAGTDGEVIVQNRAGDAAPINLGARLGINTAALTPAGDLVATPDPFGRRLFLWDPVSGKQVGMLRLLQPTVPPANVVSMAFSPDGGLLAVSLGVDSEPTQIQLWDMAARRQLTSFRGHPSAITGLAFEPTLKWLASGGEDGTVRLWSLSEFKDRAPAAIHSDRINALAVSSDGRHFASASSDRTVKLWDLESGRLLHTFAKHTAEVQAVVFSPQGKMILTGGQDGLVHFWNTQSHAHLGKLTVQGGRIDSLAMHPNGKMYAVPAGADIDLVTIRSQEKPRRLAGARTTSIYLQFSRDGALLYSFGSNRALRVWEVEPGKVKALMTHGSQGFGLCAAVSPNDDVLATGGTDRLINLWNLRDSSLIATLTGHADRVVGLAFSPDGKTLASTSWDRTVRLWKVDNPKETQSLPVGDGLPTCLAFTSDGANLLVGTVEGLIFIREVKSHYAFAQLGMEDLGDLAAIPASNKVAAGGFRSLVIRDLASGAAQVLTEPFVGHVHVAVSADGLTLATVEGDFYRRQGGTIRLWETATGKLLRSWAGPPEGLLAAAFSPDGKKLATGSSQGLIQVWEVDTGKAVLSKTYARRMVTALVFSADGGILAAAHSTIWSNIPGSVMLIDLVQGKEGAPLEGPAHQGPVLALALSPDGKWLASGGPDQTAKVWNFPQRKHLFTLQGHSHAIVGLAFSPDQKRLVSASRDNTLRIWDPATGQAVGVLKSSLHGLKRVAFTADGRRLVAAGQSAFAGRGLEVFRVGAERD